MWVGLLPRGARHSSGCWRLLRLPRWLTIFQRLVKNTGSRKKAIVAVARRVLCVMFSMLRSGKGYRMAA